MLSRRGPVWIGYHLDLPASTVGRVLALHRAPLLRECDPLTGLPIRASRRSAHRYEHAYPGSLVHIDVKKLGRIPDGGDIGHWAEQTDDETAAAGWVTTTSTPRSTTTPAWPTPRSTTTRRARPAPGS